MKYRLAVVTSAVAALLAGCGDDGTSGGPDAPSGVTYYQDLKPIIDAKCVGCHVAGGIAPFALDEPANVEEMAGVMLENVVARTMPPWPPNPDCNDYLNDRSLTDAQIAVFQAWSDGGRRMGDPAHPGPALVDESQRLSRVDLTMGLAAPYLPVTTAEVPDDYRCFVIPWPETTATHVTGFRAVPGNPAVVHHVIAFHAQPNQVAQYQQLDADAPGPGYQCFGGTNGPAQAWLGAWAPGSLGSDMPAGTGLRVEPGSAVILQIHYNVLAAGPQPDRTEIQFKLDDAVAKVARIQPWANPGWLNGTSMHIPPNQADVMHSFEFDATIPVGGAFDIYSAGLHMHTLGTRAKASVISASGEKCLVQIDDWNFHWQGSYGLRQPVAFQPGDRLRTECHWDNTAANQPIVGGQPRIPTDVYWGEGTTDEMCLGVFYVAPR